MTDDQELDVNDLVDEPEPYVPEFDADLTPEPEPEPDFDETQDLDSLAAKADAKKPDKAAMEQLEQFALQAGIDQDAINAADNWAAVVEMINAGGAEAVQEEEEAAEEETAEDETPVEPNKGDVYKYQAIDPKTRKPLLDPRTKKAKKPVEVEVVAVNKKAGLVDLKSLDDPKVLYKSVPYDQLLDAGTD